ncbi:hypothetical protein [Streptomyces inhibens]|uniref:hypothetical protein n=1 Tax=Streptomyces inhibens TaxID=2293571 RepID=UPI003CC81B37
MAGSAVGTPNLHVLNGTARQLHGADVVVLVTNGRFSANCSPLAKSQRLHVVDRRVAGPTGFWLNSVVGNFAAAAGTAKARCVVVVLSSIGDSAGARQQRVPVLTRLASVRCCVVTRWLRLFRDRRWTVATTGHARVDHRLRPPG